MAVPKQRRSKAKKRTKKAHWKITVPSLSTCANCGASTIPHRACTVCGFYKGRAVLTIKQKETTNEEG